MLPLYKAPSVPHGSLLPPGLTSDAPVRRPPRPGASRPWRLAAVAPGLAAACARRAQAKEEPGGVVQDVEYVFVRPEEADAVSEEVLQRVNTVSRAHQGLYKVPEGVADTEQGVGAITGALCKFPGEHVFQARGCRPRGARDEVVGKTPSSLEREEFLAQVRPRLRA